MLPTELAWTDDELARRLLDHEALYFSREQPPQPPPREHLLLIDASASMRGDRETFARGLAMALAKKLTLAGEAVRVRFFDSRLRDTGQTRPGEIPVVQILAFKGERGRNPARVFRALAAEVTAVAARERRAPAVHLITHAALQVPRPLVADVAKVAELHAVFILPNGGQLSLDYLDLLTSHVVVDHSLWKQRPGRAVAAAKIVSMLQCPFRRSSS
jgi:uncharacterized protein with von Willebrand factor type A (vWA) domain